MLEDSKTILIGHNTAYDMAVMGSEFPDLIPLIFKAYEDDRVTCTKIRQQILDIAAGCFRGKLGPNMKFIKYNYGLADLVRRFKNEQLDKDGFRLFYSHFRDVPLDNWVEHARTVVIPWAKAELVKTPDDKDLQGLAAADPERVIQYPLDDASSTLDIWEFQEEHAIYLKDQYRQARAAFALHLSSAWGLRTDPGKVRDFAEEIRREHAEVKTRLIQTGLVRADGTRNLKAAALAMQEACLAEDKPLHLTDGGNVSLDSDACEAVDDETIKDYSLFLTLGKVLSTDVPMLEKGVTHPVHTSYGMAASGRTTSSGPNIQNLRRL
jgi:hypothetical protein